MPLFESKFALVVCYQRHVYLVAKVALDTHKNANYSALHFALKINEFFPQKKNNLPMILSWKKHILPSFVRKKMGQRSFFPHHQLSATSLLRKWKVEGLLLKFL